MVFSFQPRCNLSGTATAQLKMLVGVFGVVCPTTSRVAEGKKLNSEPGWIKISRDYDQGWFKILTELCLRWKFERISFVGSRIITEGLKDIEMEKIKL